MLECYNDALSRDRKFLSGGVALRQEAIAVIIIMYVVMASSFNLLMASRSGSQVVMSMFGLP